MKFTPIASSSEGCCYLVDDDGLATLIIDAGVSMPVIQNVLKHRVHDVAGCLLSHGHNDHAKSAKQLADRTVPVYASEQTLEKVGLRMHHMAKVVSDRAQFEAKGVLNATQAAWRVMPFEVPHDEPGTLGFMIDGAGGNRLVYLTDLAYSPVRFEQMTHLAVECNHSREILHKNRASGELRGERYRRTVGTHMSLERLVELLKANDLSKLEEIHLLHLSDENSDESEFKSTIQRSTGVPVYVAPKRSYQ